MATFSEGLQGLDDMIDVLREERDRLAEEVSDVEHARLGICLAFPILCRLDPGELQTRGDSLLALIGLIEEQILDVQRLLPVIAKAGDAKRLQQMLNATANIINVITGTSIVSDLIVDVRRTVDDIRKDFKRLVLDKLPSSTSVGFGIGVGVVLLGAFAASRA